MTFVTSMKLGHNITTVFVDMCARNVYALVHMYVGIFIFIYIYIYVHEHFCSVSRRG